MSTIGSLIVKFGADIKDLTQDIDRVQKSTGDLGKFTATAADVAGKALTVMGTAATAVGINATRMAMNFESSFAGVKKTTDATQEEFAALAQGLRDLAQEVPVSVDELNKIAETGGALGVAKTSLVDFTKTIAMVATSSNLTADNAANSFARIGNVMGLTAQDFGKLGSAVIDLGNKGASTETDITEMASRITGAAKAIDMSAADVLGLAAAMSDVGIEAEMGGSAISKLMINIAADVAAGGDGLKAWADVAGQSAQQFATSFRDDPAQAITTFIEGLGRIKDSGGSLFKTLEDLDIKEVRLRDTVLKLAGAKGGLTKALETSHKAWEDNTALTVEAGKRYETSESQLKVFQNRLADTQITLGTALIPVFMKALDLAEPFINMLKNLAEGFADLDPTTQTFIAAVTGISTVAYPAILAIASFARAIQTLVPIIQGLWALMLAHPFVAIGAAVVALALLIYKNWDEITEATKKVAKMFNSIITSGLDPVISSITKARDAIINLCKQIADGVKTYLGDKMTAIFTKVREGIEEVKGYFKGLYHAVVGGSSIPDLVGGIQQHMGRLDGVMVQPAAQSTTAVMQQFEALSASLLSAVGETDQYFDSYDALHTIDLDPLTAQFIQLGSVLRNNQDAMGTETWIETAEALDHLTIKLAAGANPATEFGARLKSLAADLHATGEDAEHLSVNASEAIQDMAMNMAHAADMAGTRVTQSMQQMSDEIVGHSIIPDMVEEIGDHMRNLDVTMTAPARNAVVNTQRVMQQGTLTWGMTISQFASTASQAWGSLSQTAASNLARMTDETVNWGEVVKGMGIQLMTNMITLVIGLATQWAIGEAMRTAQSMAGDTARVASNATANAAMLTSNTVSATASTSIWAGAASSISGFFAMIAGGFKAIALGLIVAVKAVGTFVMGVLSAIAAAMKATIFGIPVGIAILAGVVAIAVALAVTGNIPGLAEGGMVTGPTVANIAEGGSAEAVIPLNERGAKFMQSAMGGGGGGPITIYLQVDSKTMAKAVVPKMHNVIHTKLGYT